MAELGNRVPCVMSMAADTALGFLVENMVFTLFNRLRREKMVKFMAARMLIGPSLDGAEHIPLDLDVFITKSGVVKCSQNVVDDLIDGYVRVLPCVENAA